MKEALFKCVTMDDLLISFATTGPVSDEAWALFIKEIKTKPVTKFLATSVGMTEVDSLKRKSGTEALKNKGMRVAAVTDERLVRGIATAASWFGVNIRAFAWMELREALTYLQVTKSVEQRAFDMLMELKASVPKNR